ncbi:heat shock protein HtpX [bacterium BMS3Abin07]|nr:heat shock protein HtpX [bacterium BMS3Abin07]GBE32544.1 heat shock protein HtpX [bacterium BMS3Bbin05]
MGISAFFSSPFGMFIVESFFHALIAAIIIGQAIRSLMIEDPSEKQRLRFIVILLPAFSFPLYQMINPERGSLYFRLGALFDSQRWLSMELGGVVPLGIFFILIFLVVSIIFVFQELLPIIRHMFESKENDFEVREPDDDSIVKRALQKLPAERPDVYIFEDFNHVLFSTTGNHPAIYISDGFAGDLNEDQMEAALAHEFAHISRSRRPILILVYLFRVLMFFNPVVLLEFRKIVHDEEKICDDMAVSISEKPVALAETLRKQFSGTDSPDLVKPGKIADIKETLKDYSHNVHIENRIKRLNEGLSGRQKRGWPPFILTVIIIIILNYFIV